MIGGGVFESWVQMRSSTKKDLGLLFKIYSENGICYSEESSIKALRQVKKLVETSLLSLDGPAGKTEWNNWPGVMQKRIKWSCCHSKIFVELLILFQVKRGYFNFLE